MSTSQRNHSTTSCVSPQCRLSLSESNHCFSPFPSVATSAGLQIYLGQVVCSMYTCTYLDTFSTRQLAWRRDSSSDWGWCAYEQPASQTASQSWASRHRRAMRHVTVCKSDDHVRYFLSYTEQAHQKIHTRLAALTRAHATCTIPQSWMFLRSAEREGAALLVNLRFLRER